MAYKGDVDSHKLLCYPIVEEGRTEMRRPSVLQATIVSEV